MDHSQHQHPEPQAKDYLRFAGIIIGIILFTVLLTIFYPGDWRSAMRFFMGIFFLVFSFFKLLNLPVFVESYQSYDLIAKVLKPYATLYPFIELALGLAYLANFAPFSTNLFTLILMAVGSVGVGQELAKGSKIKCACLGSFVNLPLTTVSLVEDLAMAVMAALMLLVR